MDFRDACRLFADPDFDGDPIPTDGDDSCSDGNGSTDNGSASPGYEPVPEGLVFDGDSVHDDPRTKYRVNDVEVTIINERVQYYDKDGKLITESVTDYTKKNILGEYATLDDFLLAWNTRATHLRILKHRRWGSSATIIIENGNLLLGTWQGIYFAEFDPPRKRKFYVKLI